MQLAKEFDILCTSAWVKLLHDTMA